MIAKIGYGHLCLREENISFNNKYIIQALYRGGSRISS